MSQQYRVPRKLRGKWGKIGSGAIATVGNGKGQIPADLVQPLLKEGLIVPVGEPKPKAEAKK